jgi:protein-L-isoaspartate O-methyltransferase
MNQAISVNRIHQYLPLIAFVLPTAAIGYGIVIPRSCIAGLNELTVGFGTTIVGAVFTYVAGQRAMLPQKVCTKPPLKVRIVRALNRQAACPSGWFGHVLGFIWPREHRRLNAEALDALDLRPGQHVLEIGSGTGHALKEVSRRTSGGRVVGIDVSEVMVGLARRRVSGARVEVQQHDITQHSLEAASLDRILSVHSIYFWRDPETVLAKLAAALRPGGKLVIAFRPDGDDIPDRFRGPVYRFPRADHVEQRLRGLGLQTATTLSQAEAGVAILVAARP